MKRRSPQSYVNDAMPLSLSDFVKTCVVCSDGRLLCWDFEKRQYVFVEKAVAPITEIAEADIVALKKKVDAEIVAAKK